MVKRYSILFNYLFLNNDSASSVLANTFMSMDIWTYIYSYIFIYLLQSLSIFHLLAFWNEIFYWWAYCCSIKQKCYNDWNVFCSCCLIHNHTNTYIHLNIYNILYVYKYYIKRYMNLGILLVQLRMFTRKHLFFSNFVLDWWVLMSSCGHDMSTKNLPQIMKMNTTKYTCICDAIQRVTNSKF